MTARQSATVFGVLAAALLSLPLGASAQPAPGVASKWRVEPAAGIWYRDLSGAAAGHQVGPVVSLHVSKQRGAADRLTASVGYHRLEDALELTTCSSATQCRTDSYDSETFYVTAGLAGDLWRSDAAGVSLGLEAGVAWDRQPHDRRVGSTGFLFDEPFRDDWTPVFLVVPSLAARRALTTRLDLTATGRLVLGFGDFSPETVPAVGVGLAYRL